MKVIFKRLLLILLTLFLMLTYTVESLYIYANNNGWTTTTNSSTTVVNNPNGTTTTITREEEIFKYILKPITISIPGIQENYSQNGTLKKKEVVQDQSGNVTKIIWEYTTKVDDTNRHIKKIQTAFFTTMDSGLGEPKVTSITKDGSPIANNTTYYGSGDNFKSATNQLPIENGTYTYQIETPVLIPSDNYTLDYSTSVVVEAPRGSVISYNGKTEILQQQVTKEISLANSLTLPAKGDGQILGELKEDTPNKVNELRVIGKYRQGEDRVIEWTTSKVNTEQTNQNMTFDVALDSSQALHNHTVYVYRPTETGSYEEVSSREVRATNNQITVQDVPPGSIVVVKTITNVTNEKSNHSISGAELEALKGDIRIKKNWVNGATPVDITFKVTGGTLDQTKALSTGTDTVTISNVPKFEGGTSVAMSKRIHYAVDEVVPSGYILSSAEFDIDNLTYIFNNGLDPLKKINQAPPGSPESYGITSIKPVNFNYLKYQGSGAVWGGFGAHLEIGFKIPPFAKEGDSFTLEIPEHLKIDHPANPKKEWNPVINPNNGKVMARVYHTEDRKIKFVLTSDAYSVQEYNGWYIIGNQAENIIQMNNDSSFRGPYLTGVSPNLPKWYEWENTEATIINKGLTFRTRYTGSAFDVEKTVQTQSQLNATNNGSKQGDLREFVGVNKYEYEQGENYIKWDLMYNTGRGNADYGIIAGRHQFWDYIHEGMRLYSDGNVASSIPKDIELFIADGTAAASYANPIPMRIIGTEDGGTTYVYGIDGTNIKVKVKIYPENYSESSFDNFKSTHTLQFYYENVRTRAIVARIKMRKVRTVNHYYYNGAIRAYNNGVGGSRFIYRRAAETTALGGAYPTDWYGITLKKVAYDGGVKKPLEGAIFTLYDANGREYQTVRSNADGEIPFRNLLAGNYTFKEIDSPLGYTLDPTVHTLKIVNSQNITIDGKVYNSNSLPEIVNVKPVSLQISKYELGEIKSIKGSVFRLYSKDNTSYDVTVGENTSSSEFIFGNLTKGRYILEELKSPNGYKKITPLEIEVYEENGILKIRKLSDLTNEQTGSILERNGQFNIFRINVVDEDFNVEFTKVNEQREPLADAIFELRKILPNGGYEVVRSGIASASNGKFRIGNLQGDTSYELWETNAPESYRKLNNVASKFRINAEGTVNFENGTSNVITNTQPKFNFKVIKVDYRTGEKITNSNTRLAITNSSGDTINGQISTFNGETTFTNSNNSGFSPGTYYIKEITPPNGYRLLPELAEFTVNIDGTISSQSDYLTINNIGGNRPVIEIKVKNFNQKYDLKILKKDLATNNGLNAQFELFDETGVISKGVGSTIEDGNSFKFTELGVGTYILREKTPPGNYYKLQDIKINIGNNGQASIVQGQTDFLSISNANAQNVIELTVKNKAYSELSIQKVDKNNLNSTLLGVTLKIKAKDNVTAIPKFNDLNWHVNHYGARVLENEKALIWNTSNAGDAVFKLAEGTYTVEEISAPAGYELLTPFDIVVDNVGNISLSNHNEEQVEKGTKDNRISLKLKNTFKPKIKIVKEDKDNSNIKLSGATFKLFSSDGTSQIGQDFVTLDNGEIELPKVEPGIYYLQESSSPNEYKVNDKKYKIIIDNVGNATTDNGDEKLVIGTTTENKVIPITVKNEKQRYNLKVKKRDFDDVNIKLNARFALYREDGVTAIPRMVGNTTTNNNDYLLLPNLEVNTYVLKEVSSPNNQYLPIEQIKPIKFKITNNGNIELLDYDSNYVSIENNENVETLVLQVKNIKLFDLLIKKVDKNNTSKVLSNATFEIYEDKNNDGQKENKISTLVTGENGTYVQKLGPGYYIIKEIDAPSSYKLINKEYRFQINHDGSAAIHNGDEYVNLSTNANSQRTLEFTLKNELLPQMSVQKIDFNSRLSVGGVKLKIKAQDDTKAPLFSDLQWHQTHYRGVENRSDKYVEWITRSDGQDAVFRLPQGRYIVEEVEVPRGYSRIPSFVIEVNELGNITLLTNTTQVEVATKDNRVSLILKNKETKLPKTGSIGTLIFVIIGALFIIVGYIVKNKNQK